MRKQKPLTNNAKKIRDNILDFRGVVIRLHLFLYYRKENK